MSAFSKISEKAFGNFGSIFGILARVNPLETNLNAILSVCKLQIEHVYPVPQTCGFKNSDEIFDKSICFTIMS